MAELTSPKDVRYAIDFAPDHKILATAGYDLHDRPDEEIRIVEREFGS